MEFVLGSGELALWSKSTEIERVMGGFVTYLVVARGIAPSSAVNYQRAAVTELTATLGFCPKLGHQWRFLVLVTNGLKQHHQVGKRRRDPVTPRMLLLMKRNFDLKTHIGRTMWAVILFLMYSVSRKGDNIPESANKFEKGKHAVKGDLTVECHNGANKFMVL